MISDTTIPRTEGGLSTAAPTGRFAVALSGLFAQWLRGLTINAHERLALAHLWESGSMTMSELGARIPLSRAAVTALTDRLEAIGYVVRTPDEQDRRRTMLSLTDKPGRLVEAMVREWHADVATLEDGFSADELQVVTRWLEGMREVNHRHATRLRARRDADIEGPSAGA
jgi:DNA-binding MarR family transcriptional regulator